MYGTLLGVFYSIIEAVIDSVQFPTVLAVILRGLLIGFTIGTSIGIFEAITYYWQRRFAVWQLVLIKSLAFLILINFWLLSINAISMFLEGTTDFFNEYIATSYSVNLVYSLIAILIYVTFVQINKLHRQGELLNYIRGRYHHPKRENIVLLSIDLKGSTSLTELIGDLRYAAFLKDYYSDISECIFETGGDVYQYVGDEIIIFWKADPVIKEKNERAIRCHELAKNKIKERTTFYIEEYGNVPSFRATLHSGNVAITWVGERKREVLFIGDVLNTSSRMQEICKRLEKDFLISGQALDVLPLAEKYLYPFEEKLTPRGKQKEILVFSVESNQEVNVEENTLR